MNRTTEWFWHENRDMLFELYGGIDDVFHIIGLLQIEREKSISLFGEKMFLPDYTSHSVYTIDLEEIANKILEEGR